MKLGINYRNINNKQCENNNHMETEQQHATGKPMGQWRCKHNTQKSMGCSIADLRGKFITMQSFWTRKRRTNKTQSQQKEENKKDQRRNKIMIKKKRSVKPSGSFFLKKDKQNW